MRLHLYLIVLLCMLLFSCTKNGKQPQPAAKGLSYGDSVFYLKSSTYIITPTQSRSGTYTAFPDNLTINSATGAVTVSLKGLDGQSQTGLRYRIKFTSPTNETDSTYITLAGISYADRFYRLSQNDSIIFPIYNANLSKALPAGTYNLSADNKLAISGTNGQIDIKETVRRGFFDNSLNASWKQTTLRYRTSDNPDATNSLDIILYYYNTLNDVPANVSALMQAHQRLSPGLNTPPIPSTTGPVDNNLSSDLSLSRPRPPCIIIIAH